MSVTDILGLTLSFLGVLSIILYSRFLLARNVIPLISLRLNEVEALLNSAEAVGAIPSASESRITFQILHNQFLRTRTTSHRSPSFWRQLQLTIQSGLVCKVYVLHSRIDALGLEVECVLDAYKLALSSAVQAAAPPLPPTPAAITATPSANVAGPTPPPPAVMSRSSQL